MVDNYPNPFNPETTIRYIVEKYSNVKLIVYDTSGREVSVLVDSVHDKGRYSVGFNGRELISGIYFYRLSINNIVVDNKKMILIK